MLYFDKIHILSKHINYLKSKLTNQDIFLVGGCIRDLLLGLDDDPMDIDITLAGKPEQVYKQIDKSKISIFQTEKFGTITILPKTENKKKKRVNYEITPLRQEGKYEDFRHPGEIQRTSNLLADSKRRDFSMNCIYYHLTDYQLNAGINKTINQDKILEQLEINGYLYISNKNILIIQDNKLIKKLFGKAKLDKQKLQNFGKKIIGYNLGKSVKSSGLQILLDPHRGINDILNRKIQAVGDPDKRFGEDALRIIRAIRFLNVLNQRLEKINPDTIYFDIQKETWLSMQDNAKLVKHLAKERIYEELMKVFRLNNPFGFVALLDELDVMKYIFPAVSKTKHYDQPIRYHPFDVYAHTILSLRFGQKLNKNPLVKFGILYHDVGKPQQYDYTTALRKKGVKENIYGSDVHHPQIGEQITLDEMLDIGMSKKQAQEVAWYVKYHMLPGEIMMGNPENLEKKLNRWLSKYGYKLTSNLIDVAISDRLGHFNPVQPPEVDVLKSMKKTLKKIYNKQGQFGLKNLSVKGADIMQHFGLNPSPKIGELLEKALDWVLDDVKSRNTKNKILKYLEKN